MFEQVSWMSGAAAAIEVLARGGCREALDAGADRYCDHVFLQPFVVADSRVAPRCQYIHEAILSDYLQPDLGIGGEEAWNDRGKYQTRGLHGNVEAECPRAAA